MDEREWKARGKECAPADTVKRAQKILKDLGFELKYEEEVTGLESCFASRLTLVPPGDDLMGTNGKGMSRELCMASAHGEMMERLSNASLNGLNPYDPESRDVHGDQGRFYSLTAKEQPDCIRWLKDEICKTMPEPLIGTKEDILNAMLRELTIDGEHIPAYPFYSVRKKKVEYLPLNLIRTFTGSNGLAAGNTIEEAIVEGISEIFERYSQERIIDGGLSLPEVPRSVLEKYPHILKVIEDIERDGTRSVMLLDASLGKGLPVMCGVCIQKNSGRLGVKVGAHPHMAVALERIFTEGMQGRTIEKFSSMNSITFENDYAGKRIDHWGTLKNGVGLMPADMLITAPSENFQPWPDCTGLSNKLIMWKMIDKLEELGGDVYLRDSSVTGFPAVQIYAAGVSEATQPDWLSMSIMRILKRYQYIMTHLDEADDKDIQLLSTALSLKRSVLVTKNKVSLALSIPYKMVPPGGTLHTLFMKGLCEYRLGNLELAYECVKTVRDVAKFEGDAAYEKAVFLYLQGRVQQYSEEQIRQVLERMYPDWCDKVMDDLSDPKTVLQKVYPVCNGMRCESCTIREDCRYPAVREVTRRIWKLHNQYQPSEEDICKTFARTE